MKKRIQSILPLLLGSAILAFGLFNIHTQAMITEGGVLGLLLLFQKWFNLSASITTPILDGCCYLFGFTILGKSFLKRAIFSTLSFSFFYRVFESIGPLFPQISTHPFLASLLGACFVGVGVGMVVRENGACGGDDALALSFSKLCHCKISTIYFFTDMCVLLLSLSYIPFVRIIYSILTVLLSSFIIEKMQKKKQVTAL